MKFSIYITFVDAEFLGNTDFSMTEYQRFSGFSGTKFLYNTNFWKAEFSGYANFWDVKFLGDINFHNTKFSGQVDFQEAGFSGDAYFHNAKFLEKANFQDAKFSGEANFQNAEFSQTADFSGAKFKTLKFDSINLASENAIIILRDVRIENFTLSNINRRLTTDNFIIYNIEFVEDGIIHFESVYLEYLKFVNVDWGKVSVKRISPDLYKDNPRAARNIYRQLKLALDKQENYIDARRFYALELQAHNRELEREVKKIITIPDKLFDLFGWIIPFIYGLFMLAGLLLIPSGIRRIAG